MYKMTLPILALISSFQLKAEDTIILEHDQVRLEQNETLIERTELTPEKVELILPITFYRQYCEEYQTTTHTVPCETDHNHDNNSDDSNGSPRPTNGGNVPPRPPHSEPRPPHNPHEIKITTNLNMNICTSTTTECVNYETKKIVEERVALLKFKKNAKEFKGTEIYQISGNSIGEYLADFTIEAINDLAKSHQLIKRGHKRFIIK